MIDTNRAGALGVTGVDERRMWVVRWALSVLLGLVVLRAVASVDMFPWWATDPTISPVANTSLTPAGVVLVNVMMLVCAGALLMMTPGGSAGAGLASAALFAGGFVAVVVQGYGLASDRLVDVEDLAYGTSWGAALAAALALSRTSRRVAGASEFAISVLAGGLAMIALKAGVQVWVEIPQTIEMFRLNKGAYLSAHGWSEGSPMARAFEHRLMTADASGWFGMSNVLATLGVWGTMVSIGACAAWRRSPEERRSGQTLFGVSVLGAAGLGCLIGGGSKGGYAALATGLALWGLVSVARKNETVRRGLCWVPLLMLSGVIAAVVLRGQFGERLGERSLLFRWYYLEAAWRIVESHAGAGWIWGTGPGEFRDAYAMFKNPLNPEEVSSPHNVIADFVATLGVGGACWVVLWLWQMGRSGLALGRPVVWDEYMMPGGIESDGAGGSSWGLNAFVAVAIPTVGGVWIDLPGGTPESAGTRLGGMVLAMLVAVGVMSLRVSPVGLVMAAASAGMLGLIDLAPVSIGASAWFFCMGALGVRGGDGTERIGGRASRTASKIAGVVMVLCAAACLPAWTRVRVWERGLRESFELVADTSLARIGLQRIEGGAVVDGSAEAMEARTLAAEVTGNAAKVREPLSVLGPAVDRVMLTRVELAADRLREVSAEMRSHWQTKEALSRLRLAQAELYRPLGLTEGVELAASEAVEAARPGARDPSSAWAWASTVRQAAGVLGVRTAETTEAAVVEALHEAKRRDMFNLNLAWRLFELAEAKGDEVALSVWAGEVVRLNEYMRMDPSGTRALSAEQLTRVSRRLKPREEGERSREPGDGR